MQLNDTNILTLDGILQNIYFKGFINSSTFVKADLVRIVNEYYQQCQDIIRGVNENFYLIVAVTDLVTGDGTYTWPNGNTAPPYIKIKSLWAAFSPANISSPLPTEYARVQIIDPNSVTDPSYTMTDPKALTFGDYFILLPLPVQPVNPPFLYPVTNGVKIYYIPQLDTLVNDTDQPQIFVSFQDAIVWGALIDVATRTGNSKLLKEASDKFEQRKKEIAAYASARILDVQDSVIEGQDTGGGWAFPFGQQSMS